ncbi:hypothetical protein [Nocardiopsis rhodophaea]|uniref:hypothetical protein n=1 Tax=Nocardiopsis rhodophaea TaxID=280238 RepID=UPI0031D24431
MRMDRVRYRAFEGGPDPLAPPLDIRGALDEVGRGVMAGARPGAALRELLRTGAHDSGGQGSPTGLEELRRRVGERIERIRARGRLDGTLREARALLGQAISEERAVLAADDSDDARLREAELASLPDATAAAVQRLAAYRWRSETARTCYERLLDHVLRETLASRFPGLHSTAEERDAPPADAGRKQPAPRDPRRVRAMLTALNAMLANDDRGAHTPAAFDRFMAEHGDFFPERPRDLDDLVDTLARRAAAAQRVLDSLPTEEREELTSLADQVIEAEGLTPGLDVLSGTLRRRHPGLAWSGAEPMDGPGALDLGEAASALRELADLAELETALGQDYPGAALEDIDDAAVRRALGHSAVDSVNRLRAIERGLRDAGYLRGTRNRPRLTPKALRRLGETALRDLLAADRPAPRRPGGHGGWNGHSAAPLGATGEPTGTTCPAEPGDERPIDVVRTLGNAIAGGRSTPEGRVRPRPADIEVAETEHRTSAAVCLLVDLSYSMVRRGLWTSTKQTAMALHTLVGTRFPQDAIRIIGFDDHARDIPAADLPELAPQRVQGTNLQHALALAGRHLDRHPDFAPIVLVITDGEPTAHLARDGSPTFQWPPSAQTTAATLAEVDRMTRRGARLRVVLLADDPGLRTFADTITRRNGGDVIRPDGTDLGTRVLRDFLAQRRGNPTDR